jgi:cytochrome c5
MSDQHDTPIKTPKQLITIVILAFVIPISLIGFLVAYVTGGKHGAASETAQKPQSVAERIQPVAAVNVKDANAPKVFQTGEQVFKGLCISCHGAPGIATAPKMGDNAAWAPRLKDGLEGLTREAIKGNAKGMPAKGGNPDLDDYEIALAVVYMTNASGAKFKEPAAPAAMPVVAAASGAAATPAASAPAVVIPAAAAAPVVATAPAGGAATGKALYDQACSVCHAAGVANAPKFGDKAAWAPRIASGIDALTQSVVKGKGAMPAKGTAMSASDADIKAAVAYMVGAAK